MEPESNTILNVNDVIQIVDTNFKASNSQRVSATDKIEKKKIDQVPGLKAAKVSSSQGLFWKRQRLKSFIYGFLSGALILGLLLAIYFIKQSKNPALRFNGHSGAVEVSLKNHNLIKVARDDKKIMVFLSKKR